MRYTYAFGLKGIHDTSILLAMKKFVSQFGRNPSRMISDRDFKLIDGFFSDYLEFHDNNIDTSSTTQLTGTPVGIKTKTV